ncbi:carbohydrate sulfotransferase 15-like isoform X2 [Gigantopelta aegis]|nr:carbohydrate sulfotransferase 15-like isoform X2 [Gigantopelta aegis]XP_041363506.1 carbohydrate sulfotransferase 15-like isoform X2 [Gigantopelta aegis]XP_041363507.1 carbohydrate sulfotransferase 15-like isoform X2 [Gigantopelta aegis]
MRLRWRRWLLVFATTAVFVIVYRANHSWRPDDQKPDVLREMQVYDNFAELSQEYQKHRTQEQTETKKPTDQVSEWFKSVLKPYVVAGETKMDIEKSRQVLLNQNSQTKSVKLQHTAKKIDYINKETVVKIPDDILAMEPPQYLPNYKNPCWYQGNTTTVSLRCLPYFQLIGVDKSGTTDLWFRLVQHPQVLQLNGVLGKETHWWSWRRFGFDIWVRNAKIRSFEWYLQAFDRPAQKIESTIENNGNISGYHPLITGEGSPTVFWDLTGWDMFPQNRNLKPEDAYLTPHCIHHLTPSTKFIVIFRNPTERLYSDYLFLARFRNEKEKLTPETFNYAVIRSIKMLQDCRAIHTIKSCLYNKTLHMHMPSRIMVGMYAVYLKEWYKVFPKSQILVLRNEDYSKDILGHITKVYNFLGLQELQSQTVQRIASLKRQFTRSEKDLSVGPMWNQTRTVLNLFYKEYNTELASFLEDKRFLWNELM